MLLAALQKKRMNGVARCDHAQQANTQYLRFALECRGAEGVQLDPSATRAVPVHSLVGFYQ